MSNWKCLIFFAFIPSFLAKEIDFLLEDYCKYPCGNINSTLCGCGPTTTHEELFFDYKEYREVALHTHNSIRNMIAAGEIYHEKTKTFYPPAANMLVINYDFELEYSARCWSMKIVGLHDHCRGVKDDSNVGQNIRFGPSPWPMYEMVNGWSLEFEVYAPSKVKSFQSVHDEKGEEIKTGHFTQLVWHDTYLLGCTRGYIPGDERKPEYRYSEICNYRTKNFGSNVRGWPLYEEGKSCSKCPKNTTCNKIYKHLCGEFYPIKYPLLKNSYREKSLTSITVIQFGLLFLGIFIF